jgi:hypothetical protein
LSACYEQGVNAYVVKTGAFAGFAKAVNPIGGFWVEVNEPPPMGKKATPLPGGDVVFSLEKKSRDEIGLSS